ncbi:unnamed protein product [Protopolystoma xenopodis]|uniref:Uncharacterized protein n=1 Tax=Protopolystoma xenopodis TaxID=117903 RepID=A0A3S5BWQ9_9PLAT|nr:unnamed protein product [Protopolystoma xenopodis]
MLFPTFQNPKGFALDLLRFIANESTKLTPLPLPFGTKPRSAATTITASPPSISGQRDAEKSADDVTSKIVDNIAASLEALRNVVRSTADITPRWTLDSKLEKNPVFLIVLSRSRLTNDKDCSFIPILQTSRGQYATYPSASNLVYTEASLSSSGAQDQSPVVC